MPHSARRPLVVCRRQQPEQQTAEVLPAVAPASVSRTLSSRRLAEPVSTTAAAPPGAADAAGGVPGPMGAVLGQVGQQWAELPGRYKLVFANAMAFVICNMDKVGAGQSPQGAGGERAPLLGGAGCSLCYMLLLLCCAVRGHAYAQESLSSGPAAAMLCL